VGGGFSSTRYDPKKVIWDVLAESDQPGVALGEARRLLKPGGRLLMLASMESGEAERLKSDYATWAAESGLRLAAPRSIPDYKPGWLLGVATI
jgi:hypothetical protein